jgi:hypothetical protein
MSKRFEQWTRNSEAMIVAAMIVLLALTYLISRLRGG